MNMNIMVVTLMYGEDQGPSIRPSTVVPKTVSVVEPTWFSCSTFTGKSWCSWNSTAFGWMTAVKMELYLRFSTLSIKQCNDHNQRSQSKYATTTHHSKDFAWLSVSIVATPHAPSNKVVDNVAQCMD